MQSDRDNSTIAMTRRESNACCKKLCCFVLIFLSATALALLCAYLVGMYLLRSAVSQMRSGFTSGNLTDSLLHLGLDTSQLSHGMDSLQSALEDGSSTKVGQDGRFKVMQRLMKRMMERLGEEIQKKGGALEKNVEGEVAHLKTDNMAAAPEDERAMGGEEPRPLNQLRKLMDALDRMRMANGQP